MDVSLSRPAVLPHRSEDEPLYVLIRIRSGAAHPSVETALTDAGHPVIRSSGHQAISPAPFHLGVVLDASGSMHRIVLEEAEREQWRQIARERGDLKWGRVDGREGWLWSGRTLTELQAQQRTPMQAALRALARAAERLRPEDSLAVVAFADRAQQLVAAADPDRAARVHAAAADLALGVDEQHLGNGTRLAEALRLALEEATGARRPATGDRRAPACHPSPAKLLLISDGMVEDRVATCAWVERIAEAGIPLSCIGVGDQFDEELLMWAADSTRGRFCYAASADTLEAAVAEELERLETLTARRLALELYPVSGVLFRDLCQVRPDLSALHRLEADGRTYRFQLGDLSTGREAVFVAELSLPTLPPGEHPVLELLLTGECATGEPLEPVAATAGVRASDNLLAVEEETPDLDAIAAVHAYRAERSAHRALHRGQLGEATRHLRDTRQIVERLGHADLAAELEAQAAAFEAGVHPSAERAKRIKAETRHLFP
jgi:Ca-activated chloride channel homolog